VSRKAPVIDFYTKKPARKPRGRSETSTAMVQTAHEFMTSYSNENPIGFVFFAVNAKGQSMCRWAFEDNSAVSHAMLAGLAVETIRRDVWPE